MQLLELFIRDGIKYPAFGTSASTSTIDDIFTETGTVGIVFNLNIATPNIMKLQYTDSDNLISNFKYTYQSWNSS